MTVNASKRRFAAQVTGFAYETVANKPIHAGDTGELNAGLTNPKMRRDASLGMLAAGANGLQLWRREEEVAA
jgi:hypothetical protein